LASRANKIITTHYFRVWLMPYSWASDSPQREKRSPQIFKLCREGHGTWSGQRKGKTTSRFNFIKRATAAASYTGTWKKGSF